MRLGFPGTIRFLVEFYEFQGTVNVGAVDAASGLAPTKKLDVDVFDVLR
jgi:hypothetical protein